MHFDGVVIPRCRRTTWAMASMSGCRAQRGLTSRPVESQKRPERLVSRIDEGVDVAVAVASLMVGFGSLAFEAVDVALEALETTDDFALPVRRVMNCGCTICGGILPN